MQYVIPQSLLLLCLAFEQKAFAQGLFSVFTGEPFIISRELLLGFLLIVLFLLIILIFSLKEWLLHRSFDFRPKELQLHLKALFTIDHELKPYTGFINQIYESHIELLAPISIPQGAVVSLQLPKLSNIDIAPTIKYSVVSLKKADDASYALSLKLLDSSPHDMTVIKAYISSLYHVELKHQRI